MKILAVSPRIASHAAAAAITCAVEVEGRSAPARDRLGGLIHEYDGAA
jgi:hypothetical protein